MQTIKGYLLFVAVFLTFVPISADAQAEKRIGVLMFSDEPLYRDALNAIQAELRKEGYDKQKVALIIENAEGNKAKAAAIVQRISLDKPDLLITLGTSATLAMRQEIKDVPIVFSTVYDPVESGIASGWKSSGNNTTGSSTKIPMSMLMNSLHAFGKVKRMAVLYKPGEKNSELQVRDLQDIEKKCPFKMIPVRVTNEADIKQLVPEVLRKSDALYLTGSNLVNSQVPVIVAMANKVKVITISHLDDLIVKGVLLGMCTNSSSVGQLAGQKAVMILKGAKPSSIPIEVPKTYDVLLNMKTAKDGQFQIPSHFIKIVTRTIE